MMHLFGGKYEANMSQVCGYGGVCEGRLQTPGLGDILTQE